MPLSTFFPRAHHFRIDTFIARNHNLNEREGLILRLNPIPDASHIRNLKTSPPNSACSPGTRQGVIAQITSWADGSIVVFTTNHHVYWLHGFAGSGKSAISLEMAHIFQRSRRLLASYFFFRNGGERRSMARFAATLASQLASAVPAAAPYIAAALDADPSLLSSRVSLTIQLERLVYEPFQAAIPRKARSRRRFLAQGPFIIVIDGLDECDDKEGVMEFVDQMLNSFKDHPDIPLRFFIASRVEEHIRARLETDIVLLGNLDTHSAHKDIQLFLEISFRERVMNDRVIQEYIQAHGEWPTKSTMRELTKQIGGSFVLAATVFNFIFHPATDSDPSTPMDRLPLTLRMNGLDDLYTRTLTRSQHLPYFRDIISTIALLCRPLAVVEIAGLLGIEAFEVVRVLINLQAIIQLPGRDREEEVTLCHASFRDFLTTTNRSGVFFVPRWFDLRLSYRYFLSDFRKSRGATYYYRHTPLFIRYASFFAASGSPDLTIDVEWFRHCKAPHIDRPPLYAFLSSALFYSFLINPPRHAEFSSGVLLYMLTESTQHLAMAVEYPGDRTRFWLNRRLPMIAAVSTVRIQNIEFTKDTFAKLQRNLQRASTGLQTNFPELLTQPRPAGTDTEYTINGAVWVGPMDMFKALEWIVARAQESPRTPLQLRISQEMVEPSSNTESWAVRRPAHVFNVRFSFDGKLAPHV